MAAARLGDDLVPLGSRRISLKSWSIFSLLEKDFLSKVKLACVFGQVGNEAIVVTFDDEVCIFENNKWHGIPPELFDVVGPLFRIQTGFSL